MKPTLALILMVLVASCTWAQTPVPAGQTPDLPEDEAGLEEERQPVGSRRVPGGTEANGMPSRNVFLSGFSASTAMDTHPSGITDDPGADMMNRVSGFGTLNRNWRGGHLGLSYEGGGEFYARNTGLNAAFHRASLEGEIVRRNWLLNVREEMQYAPESPSVTTRGSIPGGGIGPDQGVSQSILTRARQLSNSTVGQLDISATPRDIFTFSGDYSILRYLEAESLMDGTQAGGTGGYVRTIHRNMQLGGTYNYSYYTYHASNITVYSKSALAFFSRNLGRRLRFQLRTGPQWTHSNAAAASEPSLQVDTLLIYTRRRSTLSAGFFRGVTGGSGVFASAQTTSVTAGFGRQLSPRWGLASEFSYARNRATETASVVQPDLNRDVFNWIGGNMELYRDLSRQSRFYVRYAARKGNTGVCASGGCTTDDLQHILEVGFTWRFRPLRVM